LELSSGPSWISARRRLQQSSWCAGQQIRGGPAEGSLKLVYLLLLGRGRAETRTLDRDAKLSTDFRLQAVQTFDSVLLDEETFGDELPDVIQRHLDEVFDQCAIAGARFSP
jgi:hypothetical protein